MMILDPAEHRKQVGQTLLTALVNRYRARPNRVPSQPLPAADSLPTQEQLRWAVATLQQVAPAELTDSALDQCLEPIQAAAQVDADRLLRYLGDFVDHLLSIKCTSPNEIAEFLDSADQVLVRLYNAAGRPHPSPSQLLQLALQYALDPRQPLDGGISRFALQRQDEGYEITEYSSLAVQLLPIRPPGRLVRNPFAVCLLELVQQGPTRIHDWMQLIERLLENSPRAREITEPYSEVSGPKPKGQLQVDLEKSTIIFQGTAYSVDLSAVHLVRALLAANGQWISGQQIRQTSELVGSRPDRLLRTLPTAIQRLIESQGGKGYRLCESPPA